MDQRRLPSRDPDLNGLRVLIVGAGRSGMAAARFAVARGASVTLSDRKPADALAAETAEARRLGARILAGGNPAGLVRDADLVVVSPGVPPELELLREAHELGLPVWGEVELAARFCRGRVVGITGSNGKSTVTAMVGTVLRGAGIPGGTGGNLSEPFTDLLVRDAADAVHALELSSFQLETTETLRPQIALLLNLSADHLDRYPSLEAYARAKARLLELQDVGGQAVLNADDPASERFRAAVRGQLYLFSTRSELELGAFLRGGRLVLRTQRGEEELLDVDELPLPGAHNAANALAAALACRLAGCAPAAIADGLRRYRPLPHRLELVERIGAVAYYNDSKATNPASTACALTAFEPGTVHLILGGKDKGADWSELVSLIPSHARRVLLVGEFARELQRLLQGTVPVELCGTIPRAVDSARQGAEAGDVVLLSPGCASFDQYSHFEERGEDFKRVVRALAAPGGPDG